MKNKTIFITGATDGIGKQTAIDLASIGSTVIIHGRVGERLSATKDEIIKITGNKNIFPVLANFNSLKQVSDAAELIKKNFDKIDILFNNAAELSNEKIITEDGIELNFQVNHLAHVLLTIKLHNLLKKAGMARIINVSSMIHSAVFDTNNLQGEKKYSGTENYSLSKLMNIMFTYSLAETLNDTNITVNAIHPGVIETKLLNKAWTGGLPVTEGSKNMIYYAEVPLLDTFSGHYFENRRPMQSTPVSYDKEYQNFLWDLSMELINKFV